MNTQIVDYQASIFLFSTPSVSPAELLKSLEDILENEGITLDEQTILPKQIIDSAPADVPYIFASSSESNIQIQVSRSKIGVIAKNTLAINSWDKEGFCRIIKNILDSALLEDSVYSRFGFIKTYFTDDSAKLLSSKILQKFWNDNLDHHSIGLQYSMNKSGLEYNLNLALNTAVVEDKMGVVIQFDVNNPPDETGERKLSKDDFEKLTLDELIKPYESKLVTNG